MKHTIRPAAELKYLTMMFEEEPIKTISNSRAFKKMINGLKKDLSSKLEKMNPSENGAFPITQVVSFYTFTNEDRMGYSSYWYKAIRKAFGDFVSEGYSVDISYNGYSSQVILRW